MRAELQAWGSDAPNDDPGETLLKGVAQAPARADHYAAELRRMVEEHGLPRGAGRRGAP